MRFLAAIVLALIPSWAFAYSDTSIIDSREKATAYIEKHHAAAAPDGFSVRLGTCDSDTCIYDQASTLLALKGAYKRDYGDQRNLAYCLSYGCNAAIIANPTMGCAWRMVILASGSAELDAADVSNFKAECGQIEPAQLATAKAQAAALFRTVYKREISRDFQ